MVVRKSSRYKGRGHITGSTQKVKSWVDNRNLKLRMGKFVYFTRFEFCDSSKRLQSHVKFQVRTPV